MLILNFNFKRYPKVIYLNTNLNISVKCLFQTIKYPINIIFSV